MGAEDSFNLWAGSLCWDDEIFPAAGGPAFDGGEPAPPAPPSQASTAPGDPLPGCPSPLSLDLLATPPAPPGAESADGQPPAELTTQDICDHQASSDCGPAWLWQRRAASDLELAGSARAAPAPGAHPTPVARDSSPHDIVVPRQVHEDPAHTTFAARDSSPHDVAGPGQVHDGPARTTSAARDSSPHDDVGHGQIHDDPAHPASAARGSSPHDVVGPGQIHEDPAAQQDASGRQPQSAVPGRETSSPRAAAAQWPAPGTGAAEADQPAAEAAGGLALPPVPDTAAENPHVRATLFYDAVDLVDLQEPVQSHQTRALFHGHYDSTVFYEEGDGASGRSAVRAQAPPGPHAADADGDGTLRYEAADSCRTTGHTSILPHRAGTLDYCDNDATLQYDAVELPAASDESTLPYTAGWSGASATDPSNAHAVCNTRPSLATAISMVSGAAAVAVHNDNDGTLPYNAADFQTTHSHLATPLPNEADAHATIPYDRDESTLAYGGVALADDSTLPYENAACADTGPGPSPAPRAAAAAGNDETLAYEPFGASGGSRGPRLYPLVPSLAGRSAEAAPKRLAGRRDYPGAMCPEVPTSRGGASTADHSRSGRAPRMQGPAAAPAQVTQQQEWLVPAKRRRLAAEVAPQAAPASHGRETARHAARGARPYEPFAASLRASNASSVAVRQLTLVEAWAGREGGQEEARIPERMSVITVV